ncbi:MAG TPA: helix-turn-helix domain-containing protein [Acidimicrobiales bacterium]|nr:helix-turn-helix domain-containing protein [Acidimicrobiales bacterium]
MLTVAEYADRYSVSTSTVRRRVDRGELEAVREGRRLLVRG